MGVDMFGMASLMELPRRTASSSTAPAPQNAALAELFSRLQIFGARVLVRDVAERFWWNIMCFHVHEACIVLIVIYGYIWFIEHCAFFNHHICIYINNVRVHMYVLMCLFLR